MPRKIDIALCFILTFSFDIEAKPPLLVQQISRSYLLEHDCDLLHGNYDTDEVLRHLNEFRPYHFQNLVTGVESDNVNWFRFSIKNQTGRAIFLKIAHLKFGEVRLYEFQNGRLTLLGKAGSEIAPRGTILNNDDIFGLHLAYNQQKTYFLKINRFEKKAFWAVIQTDYALLSTNYQSDTLEGILLGCLLFITIYHILIYIITKEQDYLRLSFYLTSLCFLSFVMSGHFFSLLQSPFQSLQLYYYLLALTAFFSYWFSFYFLNIKLIQSRVIWYLAIIQIAMFGVVFMAAFFSNYELAHNIVISVSPISSVLFIYVGIKRLKSGFKPARYFLIAYLPSCSAIVFYTLYTASYVGYSWFIHNSLIVSFVFHGLLFSVAVAYKIKTYRQEAEDLLLIQNEDLEQKVKVRTQALALEKLKLEEQSAQLKMVMKELHHRVKNNLTIVSSLLELQANRLSDETAIKAFQEGQQRIEAMSLIHQRLYKTDQVDIISMDEYIRELIANLLHTYGFEQKSVALEIHIEQQEIDLDTAIPIGLILNELITNVLKYAFFQIKHPILSVCLLKENQELLLEVKDNGIGIDMNVWNELSGSFGKRLIKGLCEQIGSHYEIKNDDGTCFRLKIPLKK